MLWRDDWHRYLYTYVRYMDTYPIMMLIHRSMFDRDLAMRVTKRRRQMIRNGIKVQRLSRNFLFKRRIHNRYCA